MKSLIVALGLALAATTHLLWAADDNPVMEMSPIQVRGKVESEYVVKQSATATKTDTPLMETPVNIQVIPEQVLQDQRATTLDRALQNISGIVSNPYSVFGEENLTIRGFNTNTVFFDGFRIIEYGGFGVRNLSNAQSIEVMKGPAAILYGALEPGGMVNIVTKQPQAAPYFSVEQSIGSWNHYITDVDATGAVNADKTLLYRLNATYDTQNSWREGDWSKKTFIAPSFKWLISPQTQVSFKIEHTHNPYTNDNSQVLPYVNGQYLPYSHSQNLAEPAQNVITADRTTTSFNWSHQFNDDWMIKNQYLVNHVAGPGMTGNILGFYLPGSTDCLGNTVPANAMPACRTIYSFDDSDDTKATTLDLVGHFNTYNLKHTLLLGADYYRVVNVVKDVSGNLSTIDAINPVHPGSNPMVLDPTTYFESHSFTNSAGAYVQDQIKLPNHIDVTAGLRYQQVISTSWNSSYGTSPVWATPIPDHAVTPRIGVLWEAKPWLSVYSHYAGGFAANGGTDWLGQPLKSSDAKEKEIGVKTALFDGRLKTSFAYFDLTKTNIPVCDPDPAHNPAGCIAPIPGAPQALIGEVRSQGVELDVQGEIQPNWNVIVAYSYTDARVSKSTLAAPASNTFLEGQRMADTPYNMASVWTTYDIKKGDLEGWTFGGGATSRGATIDATNTFPTSGYAIWNAMASYHTKWGKAKATAQLNIDNIFNREYITAASPQFSYAPNLVGATFGAPRSVMASLRLEY